MYLESWATSQDLCRWCRKLIEKVQDQGQVQGQVQAEGQVQAGQGHAEGASQVQAPLARRLVRGDEEQMGRCTHGLY